MRISDWSSDVCSSDLRVLLVAGLHGPKGATGRRVYGVLALVPALAGIANAARHVWLTHLPPDQVPACGPPLSFMMAVNPLTDVRRQVLTGTGECAPVDWPFLGPSMHACSLPRFVRLSLPVPAAAFRRHPTAT